MDIPKIKICGLRIPSDVEVVNEVHPEFCGFIFVPSRKRYIEPEEAERLRQRLDPGIRPVGVFVNSPPEEILKVLRVCHLDMVQLHGQETEEEIRKLRGLWLEERMRTARNSLNGSESLQGQEASENPRERDGLREDGEKNHKSMVTRLTIVKAFRIDSAEDVRRAEESEADLILLDHGIGGTGETFDWSLIRGCRRPFFLAGGLSPENVREAIDLAHPWAVDVSSSLETDGHKDREKARRFVKAVRG